QVTHFLVHHQVHQLQPGLPQQVSYSLLQQTDDVGHRKDHLHVGILFGGEPAELLHGSLLFDLISFLHSDSLLFSWQKNNRRPIMAASLRVAYFLRIYGQSPAIAVYVLVAILKKRLALDASLFQILQVLSVTLFEKTPILRALQPPDSEDISLDLG